MAFRSSHTGQMEPGRSPSEQDEQRDPRRPARDSNQSGQDGSPRRSRRNFQQPIETTPTTTRNPHAALNGNEPLPPMGGFHPPPGPPPTRPNMGPPRTTRPPVIYTPPPVNRRRPSQEEERGMLNEFQEMIERSRSQSVPGSVLTPEQRAGMTAEEQRHYIPTWVPPPSIPAAEGRITRQTARENEARHQENQSEVSPLPPKRKRARTESSEESADPSKSDEDDTAAPPPRRSRRPRTRNREPIVVNPGEDVAPVPHVSGEGAWKKGIPKSQPLKYLIPVANGGTEVRQIAHHVDFSVGTAVSAANRARNLTIQRARAAIADPTVLRPSTQGRTFTDDNNLFIWNLYHGYADENGGQDDGRRMPDVLLFEQYNREFPGENRSRASLVSHVGRNAELRAKRHSYRM